jgi:hypothetical protein
MVLCADHVHFLSKDLAETPDVLPCFCIQCFAQSLFETINLHLYMGIVELQD